MRQVGAKIYFIDPDEHDVYVAGVSHLPFLLSAALESRLPSSSPAWKEMAPLAATGYRDISRLASGDPQMHSDICIANRVAISRWLDEAAQVLLSMRDQIEGGKSDELLARFRAAARCARAVVGLPGPNLRPGEAEFENMLSVPIERPSLLGRWGSGRKR